MERVMLVEDHSAFAQAFELVLGQVEARRLPWPAHWRKGGLC
jgi:hypothetical protein